MAPRRTPSRRHARAALALLAAGSSLTGSARAGRDDPRSLEPPTATSADAERYTWSVTTASPSRAATALGGEDAELLARCGVADGALAAVARRVADRKVRGLAPLDTFGLTFALRAAGAPHVWPRAWLVTGHALDRNVVRAKVEAWGRDVPEVGVRRCGLARATRADGGEVIAIVAVDALADLAPLPVRAHPGTWISLDAKLLTTARGARVVILGPSGEPHGVPSTLEGGRVRALFAPDRPGAFVVQVLADLATGPRPVLEAQVFADVAPPDAPPPNAPEATRDTDGALVAEIAAARAAASLHALVRDPRLDVLARAHARQMLTTRILGHDAGDGDPDARLNGAGLVARESGENVAHAASVALAHRALLESPSHRANVLGPRFDALGVAALRDPDGSVWVTELFARDLE